MTVGIPQALSHHYYGSLWQDYFKNLGVRVITSGLTDRQKLDAGIKITPGEACLPLKCYMGHLLSLIGKVDRIFVPRLLCLKTKPGIRLGCPKLIGLPDMVRALVPEARVLAMNIDLRTESEEKSYVKMAQTIGFSEGIAQRAYRCSTKVLAQLEENATDRMQMNQDTNGKFRIGLLGHAYLLNDAYLNLNLMKKMLDTGAHIICCHDLPEEDIIEASQKINPLSWYFEDHILSAAHVFHNAEDVSGIIYLLSFGCGAGSITHEVIDLELRKDQTIPFLKIVLDEHTGETGLMTRIESFLDMIKLKEDRKF
jgi:predicted nucleotide-binding protein (sugar kinase/HSP70/actin superfamily)